MTFEHLPETIHLQPLADDRHRPVSVRRKKVGSQLRVDAYRVAGPIRFMLEPLLWIAWAMGVIWLLIACDPALREDSVDGVVMYAYTTPLALLVGVVLALSSISALMWLPASITPTRSRTAFAGIGLIGSAWLFTKLHPVQAQDFEFMTWLCLAQGVLLLAVCAVPWPASPVRRAAPMNLARSSVVGVLLGLVLVVGWYGWRAASEGLVGVRPDAGLGWDHLLPLLGVLVLLLAAARQVCRIPAKNEDALPGDAH